MLTVEVVEDDLYMRTLISEWLSSDGYRVQARATLGDHPRLGVAAVVVDLRNGPGLVEETIARAKRVYPQAPLIGVSAQLSQTPQGDSKRAQEIGVSRLVAKPCTRIELLDAVSQAIRAGL